MPALDKLTVLLPAALVISALLAMLVVRLMPLAKVTASMLVKVADKVALCSTATVSVPLTPSIRPLMMVKASVCTVSSPLPPVRFWLLAPSVNVLPPAAST